MAKEGRGVSFGAAAKEICDSIGGRKIKAH
jgi:hypothetical protein